MTKFKQMMRRLRSSFTLIELLIVIGLLGALTALILPSLSADREEALADVCDYNQAGTVRVLKQYKQLTGVYPDQMHTGLASATAAGAIAGLPDNQTYNMVTNAAVNQTVLTAEEVASLTAAGIDTVCSGTGLNVNNVAATTFVAHVAGGTAIAWVGDEDTSGDGSIGDGDAEMTFDGATVTEWVTDSNPMDGKAGSIVCLWIAPTIDWAAASGGNGDWSKGNVNLGIDLAGKCPIPAKSTADGVDPEFAYYLAYFKCYTDGTAAKLIGTTCPECGSLNP